jgi:hypothetical protein
MDTQNADERRFLGVVEVDSGTLVVGDPAYLLARASEGKQGIDYQVVVDAPEVAASYLAERPVILLGQFGGDGTFPVFGEFDEDGVLARVTIDFVELDDEDEDDAE